LMQLSRILGEAHGRPFREHARASLVAYGRYGYSVSERNYRGMLRTDTGARIKSTDVIRNHDGWYKRDYWPRHKFGGNQSLGLMLFAYALGLRLPGDGELSVTIDRLVRLLGLGRGRDWPGPGVCREDRLTTYDLAYILQGLSELREATGEGKYLDVAQHVAGWALKRFMQDGWLVPWQSAGKTRFNQHLLPALLRLAALRRGKPGVVPDDWAGTEGDLHWKRGGGKFKPLWVVPGRKCTMYM